MLRTGGDERVGEPGGGVGPGADDHDLLTRDGFDGFVMEHRNALHRYASRLVGYQEAEDIVADTLLALWMSRSSVSREPGAGRAWAYGVAHHRCVNYLRKAARGRSALLRVVSNEATRTAPEPDGAILSRGMVRALIENLSDVERDALLFTLIGGFSAAETGELLGCSSSAVTSRVSRALARLRTSAPSVLEEGAS